MAISYQKFIEELDDRDLPMIKEVMLDFEF